MQNKKSKNTIIAIVVLTTLVVAVLLVSSMYVTTKVQNENLDRELAISDMELYLRRFASEKSSECAAKEEQEYQELLGMRESLCDSMLENDRRAFLTLVNPWNSIPEDWEERVIKIGRRGLDEDMFFDERGAAALVSMLKDCEAAGNRPVPISAYRSNEYQQKLFDNKVGRVLADGVSAEMAEEVASVEVAKPGTSEHQVGFAVDIIDDFYPDLDLDQQWTSTQQWLTQHCTEYGFILRYPPDTTDTTGIVFEPWHYRYVGKTLAREYVESGCRTFEEFIAGR